MVLWLKYGAKAQSYALQQVLKSFGVDVFMIDFDIKIINV